LTTALHVAITTILRLWLQKLTSSDVQFSILLAE